MNTWNLRSPEQSLPANNIRLQSRLPQPGLKWIAGSVLLWIFAAFFPANGYSESVDSKIRDAVSLYEQQDFDLAKEKFLEAHEEQPENPNLSYNLANSYYKSGKFQEALQTYFQTASGDTDDSLKQKSIYNMGNSLYRLGKLEEAANAYKKALQLEPRDMDAKFNLEFVLEQMEKQKQQKPQNPQQNHDPKQNRDKQNSQAGDDPPPPSKPENQQGNESQTPKNSPADANEQMPRDSQMQARMQGENISKREAERRLISLNEDLKKFNKKQARETSGNYRGNDW